MWRREGAWFSFQDYFLFLWVLGVEQYHQAVWFWLNHPAFGWVKNDDSTVRDGDDLDDDAGP